LVDSAMLDQRLQRNLRRDSLPARYKSLLQQQAYNRIRDIPPIQSSHNPPLQRIHKRCRKPPCPFQIPLWFLKRYSAAAPYRHTSQARACSDRYRSESVYLPGAVRPDVSTALSMHGVCGKTSRLLKAASCFCLQAAPCM